MKLYYHPVSTTCRPIMLFAAEAGHRPRLRARRPLHRRALQARLRGDQPEPPGARARRRRLPPHRELGDPQVPRRQGGLARVSEGPAEARARERAHGLVQHRLLPRLLGYGCVYPQIFPNLKRPDEHVQAGTLALGKEKAHGLAQGPRREHPRRRQQVPLRRRDHDRRLLRRDHGDESARWWAAASPTTRTSSAGWATMRALKSWAKVNEVFNKYLVQPNKGKEFVRIGEAKAMQPA